MANYSLADIKALREKTGAGMMDVKKALEEAEGDTDKALELIRVKGLKGVGKREGRSASDGLVAAHVGPTADGEGQTGVLVATDVAGAGVARDIATHIAAFSPTYLTREEVSADVVANERHIAEETARNEGKPEAALPKIIEGRLNGFFKENVLLEQAFAKDNKKTVAQVLSEAGGTLTGYVRYRVGA